MKRLYYLTGSLDSAEAISNDIHQAGITDWNFHVVSKDEAGLYRRHIHGANLFHKQDVIRNAERGGMIGLVLAIFATIYTVAVDPFGPDTAGFIYVAIFGFITLFGAWLGGLTGLAKENQSIAQFHDAIDAGQCLILVDVRAGRADAIKALMSGKHPEARLVQEGSSIVNPFRAIFGTAA
jgi:hypothetical protein